MPARYRLIDVENTKKDLATLPDMDKESREISQKDALRMMAPVLRELRERRGYSNERLVDLLRERGYAIGQSTLRVYLRPPRRQRPATAGAAARQPEHDTPAGAKKGSATSETQANARTEPALAPADAQPGAKSEPAVKAPAVIPKVLPTTPPSARPGANVASTPRPAT